MLYYRITISLKNNCIIKGVRHFDNSNIGAVTTIAKTKARNHYGYDNVIDVEAAMLSSHCNAVRYYQEQEQKKIAQKNKL